MVIQDTLIPAVSWLRRAACRGEDPELFFPISAKGPGHVQHERAKAVCRRCPVQNPCLDYALRTGQEHGIWGGTDPDERRAGAARSRDRFVRTG
ncbi:transcriptional regulator WhiB [Sphaerisporangium melleum]|uniref:Transcriptional regulator WhiB n=1 Tax=Sphaerisporangium melleum TaxID=321316 RepID=A0A917VPR8_9ACTN|nr:WhiB family transcriptional regulator [Sphaerisporangium melleum]GGL05770.1 transcriptional regulator WhiB [Sphaerisporangium melleum]GII73166.1 transcriptional regulator WhiB [Sphaerisporangium melleum]